jgi:hypothetical protein
LGTKEKNAVLLQKPFTPSALARKIAKFSTPISPDFT